MTLSCTLFTKVKIYTSSNKTLIIHLYNQKAKIVTQEVSLLDIVTPKHELNTSKKQQLLKWNFCGIE